MTSGETPDLLNSHTLCTCVASPLCEFSNVLSNCLLERMFEDIVDKKMAFLLYDFSNVSLNWPLEKMFEGIVYKRMAFLRYDFSDASSNCLLWKMF